MKCWGCGDKNGYIATRCSGCVRLYDRIERLKVRAKEIQEGAYCSHCHEKYDIHETSEWYAQKLEKLCDECFANSLTAEQYDSKEIEKEQYDEAEIEKER